MRPLLIIFLLISSLFAGNVYVSNTTNNFYTNYLCPDYSASVVVSAISSLDKYSGKGVGISMYNYKGYLGMYVNLISPNHYMFLENRKPATGGAGTVTMTGADMNNISVGINVCHEKIPAYLSFGYSVSEYYQKWDQTIEYAELGHTETIKYKEVLFTEQGLEFGTGVNVHIERFVINADIKYNFPSSAVKLQAGIGASFGGLR